MILLNINQISKVFGYSVRGARNWLLTNKIKKRGTPADGHNQYDIIEVLKAKYNADWPDKFKQVFNKELREYNKAQSRYPLV